MIWRIANADYKKGAIAFSDCFAAPLQSLGRGTGDRLNLPQLNGHLERGYHSSSGVFGDPDRKLHRIMDNL
jgi:hypothetical protein